MKHETQTSSITLRRVALSTLLCAGIALSACTSMGTGVGSVSPGGEPVAFAWKSTNGGTTGTMTATLDGRQTFTGPYAQITKEVQNPDAGPMNAPYPFGSAEWDGWEAFENPAFVTEYLNRVVAHLQSADGHRMRCRFNLNTPLEGMPGGGRGECQLDNGRSIDAVFSKA
jgi:hypothetical protein